MSDELAGWAEAAREGDPVAMTRLVQATQHELWRLCCAMAGEAAAEDLVQETYLRAMQALPTYARRAPFRVWLFSIARHACADELRRRYRRNRLLGRLAAQPHDHSPESSGPAIIDSLLATLDPDRKAAFALTQLLGLSYAEAAQTCDVPVGTIRSRVARAREHLLEQATTATG